MVRNSPLSIKGPGCQRLTGCTWPVTDLQVSDLSLQLLFQALSCQRGVYLAPLRVGYAEMQEGSTRQGEVQCCHLEPWVMKFKYVYCSVKKRIGEWVHSATKRASVCVFNIHLPSGSCV